MVGFLNFRICIRRLFVITILTVVSSQAGQIDANPASRGICLVIISQQGFILTKFETFKIGDNKKHIGKTVSSGTNSKKNLEILR